MQIETVKDKNQIIIDGALIIKPDIFEDSRGIFMENWNKKIFSKTVGKKHEFVQDNYSISKQNVLRGLHYQLSPNSQSKLVKCIKGNIFDVIVDLRKNSKTFASWAGFYLNDENHKQIWIPKGFAHGFLTISKQAYVIYKTDNYWDKSSERTIRWDDPKLSIDWPHSINKPLLSMKDKTGSLMSQLTDKELFTL